MGSVMNSKPAVAWMQRLVTMMKQLQMMMALVLNWTIAVFAAAKVLLTALATAMEPSLRKGMIATESA